MVDMKDRLWIPIALVALAALYGCRGGKETVQNAPPDEAAAEGAGSGSASSEPGMGSSEGSASSSHRGSPGGSPGRRTASGRRAPADEAAGESEIPPRGEQPRPQKTRETMTLPEGRKIRVQLDATLSSKSNGVGDTFTATVSDPLRLHGAEDGKAVTLKEGMKVEGTVTEVEPAKRVKGLAKLVLGLIELLRRLLERQAIRRMEGNSLTEQQVEDMGVALMTLEKKIAELAAEFGLKPEDLNLALGPLGNLLE